MRVGHAAVILAEESASTAAAAAVPVPRIVDRAGLGA
jgi:hypothetical protein